MLRVSWIMLIDEVTIEVEAGKGGDGMVSFRREKFIPKGGPDGGDGGDGGDVILQCEPNVHALTFFNTRKKFKAEDGERGKPKKMHGKNGEDLFLQVPPGTLVFEKKDSEFSLAADLVAKDQIIAIAKGGKGGLGNVHFATATHQTPREFKPGSRGENKILKLELKLLADVGLIGLPNAGKSTLISVVSSARPKIADYPFTTLEPNLGVVVCDDYNFIMADIPGLIEGASKGRGLGDKFLRHIERTKIILHLIDANSQNVKRDYQTIRKELGEFNPELLKKKEIIALTKIDTLSAADLEKRIAALKFTNREIIPISAVTHKGIEGLLTNISSLLL